MLLAKSLPFLLLVPYIGTVDPDSLSDSDLSIGLALGGGSYAEVARDCSGRVLSVTDHPFKEIAGSVRYRTSVFEVGVTSGQTSGIKKSHSMGYVQMGGPGRYGQGVDPTPSSLWYVTPSVGLVDQYVGLEIGCLISLNGYPVSLEGDNDGRVMPSGMIRLGNIDKTHFSASFARNMPLISGGGLVEAGLSSPVGSRGSKIWYGIGVFPYDGPVLSFKGDVIISDHFAITPTLHLKGGDAFEYGWSIGGRASF